MNPVVNVVLRPRVARSMLLLGVCYSSSWQHTIKPYTNYPIAHDQVHIVDQVDIVV